MGDLLEYFHHASYKLEYQSLTIPEQNHVRVFFCFLFLLRVLSKSVSMYVVPDLMVKGMLDSERIEPRRWILFGARVIPDNVYSVEKRHIAPQCFQIFSAEHKNSLDALKVHFGNVL